MNNYKMKNNLEENFIDYIEGKLDAAKKEELEKALENDSELKQSFLEYQHVIEVEQNLAKAQHSLSPNFVVKVMDRVEKQDSGFIRRLFMKPLVRNWKLDLKISAALATVCIAIFAWRSVDSLYFSSNSRSKERPAAKVEGMGAEESYKDLISSFKNDIEEQKTKNEELVSVIKRTNQDYSEHKKEVSKVIETLVDRYENLAREMDSTVAQRKYEQEPAIAAPLSNNSVQAKPEVIVKQHLEKTLANRAAGAPAYIQGNESASKGSAIGMIAEYQKPYSPDTDSYTRINKDNEQYGNYEENPRIKVVAEPVSTFSIDVDTASYSNARRFLSMGQMPPKDSVRVEEFINYFDYNYAKQTEKPFALHYEIAPSPLDKSHYLLKVGVKAKDSIGDNKWNLVFLVDVSGSMQSPDKIDLVKSGLKLLVNKMKPTDRIAIVTYAGSSGVALDSTTVSEKEKIISSIDGLAAGGSTNGSGGIIQAYQVAKGHYLPGAVNRVVLATDGDFNVGVTNFDELIKLIEEKRETGITLTSVGVGAGNLNDHLLEQLADKGNGNYFYLDNFQEARKVFEQDLSGNMEVVAKDVKLQIEFNPKEVLEYRLIGYDNRKLNKEDFNNDAIDAGEIGSGHTVTALYEVVLAGSELAKNQAQEYRYEANKPAVSIVVPTTNSSGELAFLKVRYKAPEGKESSLLEFPIERAKIKQEISDTSDDFRFAAAVSYFGTILRDSKFKGNYSLTEIVDLASKSKGSDQLGYKQDFINMVKNAQAIVK